MAKIIHRLKPLAVERMQKAGLHSDGGGLYLQVTTSGAKSWVLRFMRNGKAREMGLGAYPSVKLPEARQRAADCKKALAAGVDPIEQRKAEQVAERLSKSKTVTFATCAREYISLRAPEWKNAKHAAQWTNTLEIYAFPIAGDVPVSEIDVDTVLRMLTPIWYTKAETATRVRQRIEAVLDFARIKAYASGENPARWRGHLDHVLPKRTKINAVTHLAALPYAEIPTFMAELRQLDSTSARALEFSILTAARTGEVRGARPLEFDLVTGVWTIPAARMKAKREHRVPLSPRALQIVKAALEGRDEAAGPYLFQGRKDKPINQSAMLCALKLALGRSDLTVHGFRSAFRDWAGEITNFPREVCEAALAHCVKDATERAYARGDLFEKRRKLMDAWGSYCQSRTQSANIVQIRRNRA